LSEVVKLITASWSLLIDKYHIWNHTFLWSRDSVYVRISMVVWWPWTGLVFSGQGQNKKIRFSCWPIPRSLTDFMILTINSPLNKWDNCLIFGPINLQKTTKYRQKLPTWVWTSNNCIVGWLLIVFRHNYYAVQTQIGFEVRLRTWPKIWSWKLWLNPSTESVFVVWLSKFESNRYPN